MASSPPSPLPLIINNEDVATDTVFSVADPVDGSPLWSAYGASPAHAAAAAAAAQAAFGAWARQPWTARRDALLRVADELARRAGALHAAARRETGAAAAWEDFDVQGGIALVRDVAARVGGVDGRMPPTEGRVGLVYREPYGVVLGIAPWNAPVLLGLRAIVYALAAGNTVVFKGSELTPRTHYLLVDAFRAAGVAPGVVSLVQHAPGPGPAGPAVVRALVEHAAVRKINFTGSTAVGRILGEMAGRLLKPVLLELGGKATAVVLADADLAAAARVVAAGATANAGQVCTGTERVVVVREVAEAFTALLKEEFQKVDATFDQPLAQAAAADRVRDLAAASLAAGARVLYGGAQTGTRVQPTIFADAEHAPLHTTESFAPFVTLAVAADEAAAVALANAGEYGLAAAVWSRDLHRALGVAREMEAGLVHINGNTLYDEPTLPYGGDQSSGTGRFGGPWGLDEFLTAKTVTFPLLGGV